MFRIAVLPYRPGRTSFNTFQIPRKGKALNIISLVIYTCTYFSLYGMLFLFPKSLRVFPACVLCDRCTRNLLVLDFFLYLLFINGFAYNDIVTLYHTKTFHTQNKFIIT